MLETSNEGTNERKTEGMKEQTKLQEQVKLQDLSGETSRSNNQYNVRNDTGFLIHDRIYLNPFDFLW